MFALHPSAAELDRAVVILQRLRQPACTVQMPGTTGQDLREPIAEFAFAFGIHKVAVELDGSREVPNRTRAIVCAAANQRAGAVI